jgi:carbonic anhydrase
MQLINFQTRWMYTGTKTFPPCEGPYLWNVAQFVYPLKEKHYNLIKGQLQRSNDESIKENGNNRQVQTLDSKH